MATSSKSKPAAEPRRASLNRTLEPAELKAKVRAAALELIGRHGYEDVHVTHIAKAAGVAKGTFFKIYPSKADVLVEVLREIDAKLVPLIGRLQPTHARSTLQTLADEVEKVLSPYAKFAPALAAEMVRRPEFARLGLRLTAMDQTGFTKLCRGLPNQHGYIADPDGWGRLLADLWMAALIGWMRQPYRSFSQAFKATCRVYLNLVLREAR